MTGIIAISSIGGSVQPEGSSLFSLKRRFPEPRTLVVYETLTSMRVGYVDEMGQWRGITGQREIQKVLSWTAVKSQAGISGMTSAQASTPRSQE